jgi:hypothetical protein
MADQQLSWANDWLQQLSGIAAQKVARVRLVTEEPGQEQQIGELEFFLATRTQLATTDPSIAYSLAVRLYEEGWRKAAPAG